MLSMILRNRGRRRLLPWVVAFEVVVSAVLGWVSWSEWHTDQKTATNVHAITQQQQSTSCWDEVLTTAIRDHLNAAQRAQLVDRANHCANLTEPEPKP